MIPRSRGPEILARLANVMDIDESVPVCCGAIHSIEVKKPQIPKEKKIPASPLIHRTPTVESKEEDGPSRSRAVGDHRECRQHNRRPD